MFKLSANVGMTVSRMPCTHKKTGVQWTGWIGEVAQGAEVKVGGVNNSFIATYCHYTFLVYFYTIVMSFY